MTAALLLVGLLGQSPEVAAQLHDEGDHAGAAAAWEELLRCSRSGECAPLDEAALDYNLGNARFRQGRLGLAMLHWERALWRSPGEADARANLELARELVAGRLSAEEGERQDPFALELLDAMTGPSAWLGRAPVGRLRLWVLVAAFVAGGLLTSRILGMRQRWVRYGLAAGLAATVVAGSLLALRLGRAPRGMVVEPAAVIRSGPGESFPQLARVPEGLEVELRGVARDNWTPVAAAGIVGFADAASVVPIVPE